jgi:hypothetical protein
VRHPDTRAKPGARPPEVDRLVARLRSLHAEVRRFEVCAPGSAAELRREASGVACRLEKIKIAILCAELKGRQVVEG